MQNFSLRSVGVPLILLSFGFILVGVLGYAMSPDWLSASEIQEIARKNVPAPAYPPAPAGRQETQSRTREVCTQVPTVAGLRVTMKNVCNQVREPFVVAVGPSKEDNNAWQATVGSIRRDYEMALRQEEARISERQRADLKSFVKDMIQIATGVLGLVTGIIALVIGNGRGTGRSNSSTGENGIGR